MNPLLAKCLKIVYRKEPISGFILLFGLTDIMLGSFQGRWSLFSIGLLIAILGIVVRWRQVNKKTRRYRRRIPRYHYHLPPSTSAIPLPTLTSKKRYR